MVPIKETGENLVNITINCLLEWNLDKICTVTKDNHSANDAVARCLQECYLSRGLLLLSGKSTEFRCWGLILNLIAHECLDEIKVCIQKIQNDVKYMMASQKKKLELLQYADQERIPKVTMDNDSTNGTVSRCLQEHYLSRGLLLLSGKIAQFHCSGYILNLIVQEGLDKIKVCNQRIQNPVKYAKASPMRKLEFLQYAEQ
ncbi:hypothetical protein ACH5RR_013070 [Cinchona calisaya]|uniref:Uncharacterized protein n=1 Tax=Cinchona calisaya TaxID=153742 RepID=A0ABD2ZZH2_9GENT